MTNTTAIKVELERLERIAKALKEAEIELYQIMIKIMVITKDMDDG